MRFRGTKWFTANVFMRLGLPLPWAERELLGRPLRVRYGTLRARPDKDDAWLLACALHAKHILDVGSNVGQAALLMLRSASVRSIVLVDPNPEALAVAAEQLIHNHLSAGARFVTAFVAEREGETVEFWTVGTGSAGSRYAGHAQTAARKGRSFQVPTTTVDRICEQYGMLPDLVKIDVEGAEHEVLLGSRALASHQRTRFFVEMHSPPELPMVENARRVLDWCAAAGYAAWYLTEKSRFTAPEQIRHRGRCHLLLQPGDWPLPVWLEGIEQSDVLTKALTGDAALRNG